jgi:hypothetical protein
MSGGPAFDASGDVIGVNVSGYLFKQLVSFLVPADYAKALIARAKAPAPSTDELKDEVLRQIKAHSGDLIDALSGPFQTQALEGFTLPAQIAPFIDCNASGDASSNRPIDLIRIECNGKAGIQLQPGLVVGDIHYIHLVLATTKLGSWRFSNRLSTLSSAAGHLGFPQQVAPFACDSRVIKLSRFDANVVVCARGYRKFPGIYDFTARVVSLSYADRGFVSHLDLAGVEFDHGLSLVQRFLASMEARP